MENYIMYIKRAVYLRNYIQHTAYKTTEFLFLPFFHVSDRDYCRSSDKPSPAGAIESGGLLYVYQAADYVPFWRVAGCFFLSKRSLNRCRSPPVQEFF